MKLTRTLNDIHPAQYRNDLAKQLRNYGVSVGSCGLSKMLMRRLRSSPEHLIAFILTSIATISRNSSKITASPSTVAGCQKLRAMSKRRRWSLLKNFIVFIPTSIAIILRNGSAIMLSPSVILGCQKLRALPMRRL